jgi:hypothetical protein
LGEGEEEIKKKANGGDVVRYGLLNEMTLGKNGDYSNLWYFEGVGALPYV